MAISAPSDALTRVRRRPERGSTDRAVIDPILDAALLCHLGYVVEGRPVVIPTLCARDGDSLVIHGSAASRAMRSGAEGLPVCATVTILDGLVLARSTNNHSANYRSVVVHGDAVEITELREKTAALRVLTDRVSPGRWGPARPPDDRELRSVTVLRLPLTHAVAKVRTGGVGDDERDLDRDVWAGVVPVRTVWGTPEVDGGVPMDLEAPSWRLDEAATGVPLAPVPVGGGGGAMGDRSRAASASDQDRA